jgi:hypothetical protein
MGPDFRFMEGTCRINDSMSVEMVYPLGWQHTTTATGVNEYEMRMTFISCTIDINETINRMTSIKINVTAEYDNLFTSNEESIPYSFERTFQIPNMINWTELIDS